MSRRVVSQFWSSRFSISKYIHRRSCRCHCRHAIIQENCRDHERYPKWPREDHGNISGGTVFSANCLFAANHSKANEREPAVIDGDTFLDMLLAVTKPLSRCEIVLVEIATKLQRYQSTARKQLGSGPV